MSADTQTTPAEAGRSKGNGPGSALIVHPGTGEVFDEHTLESEPPENIADLLLALREHIGAVRRAETLVAQELERRLATRKRSKWVVGDFEVERAYRNSRVWDGAALEQTLTELLDDGVVDVGEVADVLEHTIVVHGKEANSLQRRLIGDAERAVADCWHWDRKPGGVSVVRSIPLVAESAEHTD
jgi:hypothetical protein